MCAEQSSVQYTEMIRRCQKFEEQNRKLRAQLESLKSKSHEAVRRSPEKLCEICLLSMSDQEFAPHLCPNQGSIACEYCTDATFTSILALREHLSDAAHANVTFYKCGKCTLAFPMRKLLEIHEHTNKTHSNKVVNRLSAPPMSEYKN